MEDLDLVAIMGSDDDACRLARLAAYVGCVVRIHDPNAAALALAHERIRTAVEAAMSAGHLVWNDRQRVLDGILTTTDIEEAVTHVDLVLAMAAQPVEERRALLARLGEACRASTVVALCIDQPHHLADAFPQPGRLVGLRVPPRSDAGTPPAEIVATVYTAAHALDRARRFVHRLGHEVLVRCAA